MTQKKEKKKKNKKPVNRMRKIALDVILVCLIGIFLVSAYNVYTIMTAYKSNQKVYTALREDEGFTGDIDWDKMRGINPDIVAWLYLEDSKIDYPIVQGDDNDKYLHTMFNGQAGGCGTLFVDSAAVDPFKQFNTIVYGHHMRDGSMFNNLKKFKDPEYAKTHSRFELITPEQKYHLDVLAFLNIPADSPIYTSNISDDAADDYMNLINNKASYVTSNELEDGDQIVILSTCAYEYDNARYVVVGKMVPWE